MCLIRNSIGDQGTAAIAEMLQVCLAAAAAAAAVCVE
jgi:hypothetical protein